MKLLASAPTLERITKMVNEFYCSTSKALTPDGENVWRISGINGIQSGVHVRLYKGRYRFESEAL